MLGDARRRRQPGPFRDHSSTAQARVHGGALALERPGRRTRGGARPRRPRAVRPASSPLHPTAGVVVAQGSVSTHCCTGTRGSTSATSEARRSAIRPTGGTEAASLAGEGHQALEGAVGTPKPREAMAQQAAREELAELLLDEARQAVPVAAVRDLPEEGLQVLADDGVEDEVFGVAGLVCAMGMGHAQA
jgi:hypothetical protein